MYGTACSTTELSPLTPYDQPLVSRRSMLSRDRKVPPRMSLAVSNGTMSPSGLSGSSCPPTMLDCGAPGRFTSRILGLVGRGGGAVKFFTPFATPDGGAQCPNLSSSKG